MDKRFFAISIFALVLVVGVMIIVSAQIGSGVIALFLLNAMPLNVNGTTNTCMIGAPAPCLDTDGGYAPDNPSVVMANVIPMNSSVIGGLTLWNPSGSFQCVQSSEVCDVSGNLFEVVCGSSVGIPNAAAFATAFPGNSWGASGEPVALFQVNCATFAANNPGLGLTGACSNGACV